jgi:putative mRNA 3-end processing factor
LYNTAFPVTFGTAPTKELSELLIEDSIKINRIQRSGQHFFRRELKSFMEKYVPYEFGKEINFGDYKISLHDAGHISGSAMTLIENKTGRKLMYTGDFKPSPQLLQHGADDVKCDILITESTYATREHPDRTELIAKFVRDIQETIGQGGSALLPVFAVGRAQEMLAILEANGLAEIAYIDGMARAATEIVMNHPHSIDDAPLLKRAMGNVGWIDSNKDRTKALSGGSIILTTAGMLTGGPVLNYITKLARGSKIFLTGYQVEGTNGRNLMDGKPLEIEHKKVKISTPWAFYDFSAHAGKTDLYEYIRRIKPETVICVHGDPENSKALSEALKLEGFDSHAPKIGDKINVDF